MYGENINAYLYSERKVSAQTPFKKLPSGGVAQWTSHLPQEQKTKDRIPPGFKVFRENIATLLCMIDLMNYWCF
jgi:hypothetical protein